MSHFAYRTYKTPDGQVFGSAWGDMPGRRFVLNSAVITAQGLYEYRLTDVEGAKAWLDIGPYQSIIGYTETAELVSFVLGFAIPVNRTTISMACGDSALVARIKYAPGQQRINPADKGELGIEYIVERLELGLLRCLGTP